MKKAAWLIILGLAGAHLALAQQPDLGTEAQREAGRQLYLQKCAQCHGDNGDAESIATPYFKPEPRDFTAGVYKIRSTPSGELPTDQDLINIIRNGMPYTGMPAWPDLNRQQLTNLMYYIKTFSADFADPDYLPEPIDFPKPPRFSEESAEKGRAVFEANECIACHGNLGRGDGVSAPTLTDEWGNHIRPADMTKRWTFRGGSGRADIYRTFTTGMNGTPMPSYRGIIDAEDQWHLVDYVYALSRDNPNYATILIATAIEDELDLSLGKALFEQATAAYFPIVGQVVEPGREFYPGINGIEVKAVYNENDIAIMLLWHDMIADTVGKNSPALPVPRFSTSDTTSESFADAVAIQMPSKTPDGPAKPYFMFGDRRNSVDLWFIDLAKKQAELFVGKGSDNVTAGGKGSLTATARYEEGEWMVIFKNSRRISEDLAFEPGAFMPLSFTAWDGFNKERGNKRGISSWYYLYLEPMETRSAAWPMAKWGLLTLFVEALLIFYVRTKYGRREGEGAVAMATR